MQRNDTSYKSALQKYGMPLQPLQISDMSGQLTSLYGQYSDSLGLLKAQRGQLRGNFQLAKGAAKDQARNDMFTQQGAANERGVLGSSMDILGQQDVRDTRTAAIGQARQGYSEGLLQNLAQKVQAGRDYELGMFNLKAQRSALKSSNANSALLDDALALAGGGGRGGGGGGGFGGGGGGGNSLTDQQLNNRIGNKRTGIHDLLDKITNLSAVGQDTGRQESQVMKLFRTRNNLRGMAGLDPIRRKKIMRMLEAANVPGKAPVR